MAVNLPKIADTPYLSLYCNSTKQNDNVTMMFPVNSSLQCFRTAALSMVTLNMESRSPMGRVNAENRSKTQKPLGFKGLRQLSTKHFEFSKLHLSMTSVIGRQSWFNKLAFNCGVEFKNNYYTVYLNPTPQLKANLSNHVFSDTSHHCFRNE